MIGDPVSVREHHYPPARKILELTRSSIHAADRIYCFSVGGESGSGKSTLSLALKEVLEEEGLATFIFHMDDYFHLPPQSNHERRMESLEHVGPQEVNLELLDKHLRMSREGSGFIEKPLVHYRENVIRKVMVDLHETRIVIAEGTYTTLLNNVDCRIFMTRNYEDTYQDRIRRNRDPVNPANEEILKIEHRIIRPHTKRADILIDKKYNVIEQSGEQPT